MEQPELNEEQCYALESFKNGHNLFITGQGGSGKSFLISEMIKYNQNNQCSEHTHGKKMVITSSTGISASLINGITFHSFVGVGLSEEADIKKVNKPAQIRWNDTSILIIDEVSMLTAKFFDLANNVGKRVRNNNKPFGGIQVVLLGDFLQLPPINGNFIFHSSAWDECKLKIIYLRKNMRQSDKDFYEILRNIRVGKCTGELRNIISNYVRLPNKSLEIKPTKLYPKRKSVNDINIAELRKLPNIAIHTALWGYFNPMLYNFDNFDFNELDLQICPLTDDDKLLWANLQIMYQLPIAVGAQVMLTKNLNCLNNLVNGSRGVVLAQTKDYITVKFMSVNGNENIHSVVSEFLVVKVSPKKTLVVKQFPLLLAYASTIHKCQGMTLDCVQMDLSECFEYGMVYVALSRVRTLENLYIEKINFDKIKAHPEAVNFYKQLSYQS